MYLFVGMMCAVRFSADQLFYRAEILNIVDSNHIEVKYVDYGNIEVVSVQRIRKLLDTYTILTVQVGCDLFAYFKTNDTRTQRLRKLRGLCHKAW